MTIGKILAGAKSLPAAMAAMAAARPRWRVVDVVPMDEYTHDVIVESRGRWAVIDAT